MAALLEVEDVHKSFGGVHAVRGCGLKVQEGTITGLIGPNGAGKTTLFSIIAGAIPPDQGSVRLRGEPVHGLPAHRLVEKGLVRTFQVPREFGDMSVRENLMVGRQGHPGERLTPWVFRSRLARQAEREAGDAADAMLAFLGLGHLTGELAVNLSGGQKKLLELGRALMAKPRVVLLDEPVAGVNPTLAVQLMDRIDAMRAKGTTFFLIEHDMDTVMGRCDHVIAMHEGRVLTQGEPRAVQEHPDVLASYLGG